MMKVIMLLLLTLCTIEGSLRIKESTNLNFAIKFNTGNEYRILFIGDSILSEIPERLSAQLHASTERNYIIEKIVIPSAKIANIYRNLDKYLTKHKPNLIISLLGKTDTKKGENQYIPTKNSNFHFRTLTIIKFLYNKYSPRILSLFSYKSISNEAPKKTDNFQQLTSKADIHLANGEFNLASPLLLKATKLNQADASTYLALSYSLQKETKFNIALKWADKANSLKKGNPKTINRYISIFLESSMKSKHLKYINRLKTSKADAFLVNSAFGNYHLKYKSYSVAEDYFKKCILMNKSKSITYLNLGRSLMHQGKNLESFESFRQAVRLGINNNENHLTLVLHALEMGFAKELDDFYRYELINAYPNEKRLYTPIARILINLGDYKQSLRYLKLALVYNPQYEATQKTADLLVTVEPKFKKVIEKLRRLEGINYSDVLHETYPLFAKKVLKNNIDLILMQYPEKRLSSLTGINFQSKQDIHFLDSMSVFDNFNGDERLFQDDKAHLTIKGSSLIAKEIANIIDELHL